MPEIKSLFVTKLYRAELDAAAVPLAEVEATCRSLADDDEAGQAWCRKHGYPGYTSYASLNDLPWRYPVFKKLIKALDAHVAGFARALEFDLGGEKLKLDDIWVNVLPEGGVHTSHIHPRSVISGTYYFGEGTEFDESKLKPLKMGTAVIVPANAPHYSAAKDGETLIQEIGVGPTGTNIWPKAAAK